MCCGTVKFNATVNRISSSRKHHKMRQRYVTSPLPRKIPKCSRRAVLNPDRSMNRRNQLTIQLRASNRGEAILSILSIFQLARPHSKTVFDLLRSFSSLSLSLVLSRTNHPLSSLSSPCASYLPILFLRGRKGRCSITKCVRTNSISRQKHRTGIASDTANRTPNIAKIIGSTIECSRYIERINRCIYLHERIILLVLELYTKQNYNSENRPVKTNDIYKFMCGIL